MAASRNVWLSSTSKMRRGETCVCIQPYLYAEGGLGASRKGPQNAQGKTPQAHRGKTLKGERWKAVSCQHLLFSRYGSCFFPPPALDYSSGETRPIRI